MKEKIITENNQSIYCYPGTSILINKKKYNGQRTVA